MKLTRETIIQSYCPVCALGGVAVPLTMAINNIEIHCMNGHRFDTIELSKLAARVGHRDKKTEN